MPSFLRKIERKPAWDPETGDLSAALEECRLEAGRLSVWIIEDYKSLDQVVAALAANRGNLAHLDYILFEAELLTRLDIHEDATEPGTTLDQVVNQWHRDLIFQPDADRKLREFVATLRNERHVETEHKEKVKELIAEAVCLGRIPFDKLNPNIQKRINPLLEM